MLSLLVHMITVSISRKIILSARGHMRPMRWAGDVDQSEFEHACQSALSLNYLYDNDLCQQYEYDTCNKYYEIILSIG